MLQETPRRLVGRPTGRRTEILDGAQAEFAAGTASSNLSAL